MISRADYVYGYADALRDHVVRPVVFMNYGGPMRWRTSSGDEVAAGLGELLTKDLTAQAWRTALDPKGEWISAVLRAADRRLTEVRRHLPDAGGLVIASNQTVARAYARILAEVSGARPTVVLSDDAAASGKIERFAGDDSRWMVAVRMVSEGVDVPRLAVGVFATSTSTPLFFAQAVGRFVRARRRGELATVFLPTVPILLAHAASLERQRDHVLGRPKAAEAVDIWAETDALLEQANRTEQASDELLGFERLVGGDLRPRAVRSQATACAPPPATTGGLPRTARPAGPARSRLLAERSVGRCAANRPCDASSAARRRCTGLAASAGVEFAGRPCTRAGTPQPRPR